MSCYIRVAMALVCCVAGAQERELVYNTTTEAATAAVGPVPVPTLAVQQASTGATGTAPWQVSTTAQASQTAVQAAMPIEVIGSMSFAAPGLNAKDVVAAAKKALASEFGVPETLVDVRAHQSRRLHQQENERRLVGNWKASYNIKVPPANAAAATAKQEELKANPAELSQTMGTNLGLPALEVSVKGTTTTITTLQVTTLAVPIQAGATVIEVTDLTGFSIGDTIQIGSETKKIAGFSSIILDTPTAKAHSLGTTVQLIAKAQADLLYSSIGEGECRDNQGHLANFYQKGNVDYASCRSRCSLDSDCVAFNSIDDLACVIWVPNKHSAPADWTFTGGHSGVTITTASKTIDETQCMLKADLLYTSIGEGECRDNQGRLANVYHKAVGVSYVRCRDQCQSDSDCVAFNSADGGACTIWVPNKHSAPQQDLGWKFITGYSGVTITTASKTTGETQCMLKAYKNIGAGLCGDNQGNSANAYYMSQASHGVYHTAVDVSLASCLSQCNSDSDCVAFNSADGGACTIWVPNKHSAPSGWKFIGGYSGVTITTADGSTGTKCMLKAKHGPVAPAPVPTPAPAPTPPAPAPNPAPASPCAIASPARYAADQVAATKGQSLMELMGNFPILSGFFGLLLALAVLGMAVRIVASRRCSSQKSSYQLLVADRVSKVTQEGGNERLALPDLESKQALME
jgi:hypothetical protein